LNQSVANLNTQHKINLFSPKVNIKPPVLVEKSPDNVIENTP